MSRTVSSTTMSRTSGRAVEFGGLTTLLVWLDTAITGVIATRYPSLPPLPPGVLSGAAVGLWAAFRHWMRHRV